MLYKVSPFGYFARPTKISRGPWFNENAVEEDGLEYFYLYHNGSEHVYILSSNLPWQDRERLQYLYHAVQRNQSLAWFGGLWLGFETIIRVNYFKKLAFGWKALSLFGTAFLYKNIFSFYNAQTYGPLLGAFFRKYQTHSAADAFTLRDRKREFYEIDTTQYMNYTYDDLGHEYHANHGPQPDGEALDSSWLNELGKFLKGEENKLKEHRFYQNYNYEYIDKSYPTVEKAHDLFNSPALPTVKLPY